MRANAFAAEFLPAGAERSPSEAATYSSTPRAPQPLADDLFTAYLKGATIPRPYANLVGVDVSVRREGLENQNGDSSWRLRFSPTTPCSATSQRWAASIFLKDGYAAGVDEPKRSRSKHAAQPTTSTRWQQWPGTAGSESRLRSMTKWQRHCPGHRPKSARRKGPHLGWSWSILDDGTCDADDQALPVRRRRGNSPGLPRGGETNGSRLL